MNHLTREVSSLVKMIAHMLLYIHVHTKNGNAPLTGSVDLLGVLGILNVDDYRAGIKGKVHKNNLRKYQLRRLGYRGKLFCMYNNSAYKPEQ